MSGQKIKNPKATNIPKTPMMNDRDFANDVLTTERYMTDAYSTALNEASHEDLYNELIAIFNETQACQRAFFNLMFQKGWYRLDPATDQQIQQSHKQFHNYTTTQFAYDGQNLM